MPGAKETEKRLAENSFTSSFHYDSASNGNVIEFPIDIRSLTVVELCSGGSNIVKRLSDQGAKAFGVDVLYKKPYRQIQRAIQSSIDRYQVKTNKARRSVKDVDMDQISDLALALNPNLLHVSVDDGTFTKSERESSEEFLKDFLKNRHRYVGNLASNLSFLGDNTADFIFSIQGVSRFLAGDFNVLMGVIDEALRVLKSGSELHLYPWLEGEERFWSANDLRNMISVEKNLDQKGIEHLNEFTGGQANRLVIIKT